MTAPRSILIVRLSSLGDILHTLPAFQSLRSSFPDAQIGWLVERRIRFLLDAVPGIDRIHVVDTRSLKRRFWRLSAWRDLVSVIRTVRALQYGIALDFQGLLKTALLAAASGAPTRAGFSSDKVRERPAHWFYNRFPDLEGADHVVDLNRRLAQTVGGAVGSTAPIRLRISDADEAFVRKYLETEKLSEFVVINPGGGWPTKIWQPRRFGELASRIHAGLGLRTVVTTGPGEEPMYDAIAAAAGDAKPLHARLSFLQLVPLLRHARLMIGGDTGPFHLACLLGRPVVAILGPTSPVRNGPWTAADAHVWRHQHCSPCHLRACPTENECMDISVDEVFHAVGRRLAAAPRGGGEV
jgi:heptosyltransferase I